MQIEFFVTGLKPTLRRRSETIKKLAPIAPAVEVIVLAFQIEHAIQDGRARDYADVARGIGMTRARVSQVMRLLHLPPAILNRILQPDHIQSPHLCERRLRPLVAISDPDKQLEKLESWK